MEKWNELVGPYRSMLRTLGFSFEPNARRKLHVV